MKKTANWYAVKYKWETGSRSLCFAKQRIIYTVTEQGSEVLPGPCSAAAGEEWNLRFYVCRDKMKSTNRYNKGNETAW